MHGTCRHALLHALEGCRSTGGTPAAWEWQTGMHGLQCGQTCIVDAHLHLGYTCSMHGRVLEVWEGVGHVLGGMRACPGAHVQRIWML